MGLLNRLFGKKKLKKANIVLLGASGAGKTTFIRYLESGKPVDDDPELFRLYILPGLIKTCRVTIIHIYTSYIFILANNAIKEALDMKIMEGKHIENIL